MNEAHRAIAIYILVTLCSILVLIPLHGFLTTWAGSNTGGLLIWRAWKEILLVPAVLGGLYLVVANPQLRKSLVGDPVVRIGLIMSVWLVFTAMLTSRDIDALVLGLVIYLRLFLVYTLARIALYYHKIKQSWVLALLLTPLVVVVGFGLLQMFVLPHDFLIWFGYQKDATIPPFFMIDQQMDALRIMSTSRGPNSLGVYLILPILILITLIHRQIIQSTVRGRQTFTVNKKLFAYCILLLVSLVVLYGSHSRSAWIGLLISVGVYGLVQLPKKSRHILLLASVILLPVVALGVYQFRSTAFIGNTIFHDNPDGGSERSSNEERLEAWGRGVQDIAERPLAGCGPGCAGPASFHHDSGANISENQYLQAGQEGGIVAVVLLIAVIGVVVSVLLRQPGGLQLALLGSFIGISAAGLLMHAWADDIVAYTWWISFGLLVTSAKKPLA